MRRELRDKRHPGNCMDPKFFLAQATDSSAQVFQVVQGSSGSSPSGAFPQPLLQLAKLVREVALEQPGLFDLLSSPIAFSRKYSNGRRQSDLGLVMQSARFQSEEIRTIFRLGSSRRCLGGDALTADRSTFASSVIWCNGRRSGAGI